MSSDSKMMARDYHKAMAPFFGSDEIGSWVNGAMMPGRGDMFDLIDPAIADRSYQARAIRRIGAVPNHYALGYGANAVTLTLTRNDTSFAAAAITANQRAAANGLDSLRAGLAAANAADAEGGLLAADDDRPVAAS